MIQSIEIWDFESHEHTLVKDLSPGFNLIFGESNAGKCLTGDTVILDMDGSMRTIQDMFQQGTWYAPSIDSNSFSFEEVSAISANGNKPVFALETSRGRQVKATSNHKFLTPNGWKVLEELKAGDWVAIARNMPVFGSAKLPDGHARLLGYLLGDGGITDSVSFTNEEEEVLKDFKKLVLSLGDHHFRYAPAGNATCIYPSKPLNVENRKNGKSGIAMFCDEYGLFGFRNKTKHIPDVVFTCCEEDIKEIIRGLLVTDGHVHKRKGTNSIEVGFNTTSKVLANQISHLLTRFGIVSTVRRKNTSWTYSGEKRRGSAYSVEVHGRRFVCRLGEVLGYDFAGKKSKLLKAAVDSHDMDRTICRYDVVPRTEEMIEIVRKAIMESGKSDAALRKETGMHPGTKLEGSEKNASFGMVFLEKLAKATGSIELLNIVESDLYWDKVRSIKYTGIEPTFDIEVPKTSSFFANDIYTHNTSIIRALKLVAYNEFDPKSIRVGKKSCMVEVHTDKGRVKVTRGAEHIWEVQKNGENTEYFEKIGKNILPEAAEVVGLSMVKLGDIEMPVNIMNQLEGHFMLSELNGKSATGSIRAQIIDEISGLSGIEGIIKEVSLDNHRWGREVKQLEDKIEEIAAQKHDPDELDAEQELLEKVRTLLKEETDCKKLITEIETLCDKVVSEGERIEAIEAELKKLPDDKKASTLLDVGLASLQSAKDGNKLVETWVMARSATKVIEDELRREVDVKTAEKLLQNANTIQTKATSMALLSQNFSELKGKIGRTEREIENLSNELREAKVNLDDLLSTIKVCPLSELPVGPNGCCGANDTPCVLDDKGEIEEVPSPDEESGDGLFEW